MKFNRQILCLLSVMGLSLGAAPDALSQVKQDDADQVDTTWDDQSGVITKGTIRVRLRHENDHNFAKYNPFYWEKRVLHFSVEDRTVLGEKRLRFKLYSDGTHRLQGGLPNIRIHYIGNPDANSEVERSKFAINALMQPVNDSGHEFSFDWQPNPYSPEAEALDIGKMMTFEFGIFLDPEAPEFARQTAENPHTIFAYYSEFFRIRLGQPGLWIDHFTEPGKVPSTMRLAGGATTTQTIRIEPWRALQQQATNISPEHSQQFMEGRAWFHTDMISGQHVADPLDLTPIWFPEAMAEHRRNLIGAAYNQESCNGCHVFNGLSLNPEPGELVTRSAVKLFLEDGSPDPLLGSQIQTQGSNPEAQPVIAAWRTKTEYLDDGTSVELRWPELSDKSVASLSRLGLRRTPALIGMGLIDAIDEADLERFSQKNGGVLARDDFGRVGRFGWKAQHASLRNQIVAALREEMGTGLEQGLDPVAIDRLEQYVALLGVPPRLQPHATMVKEGGAIFNKIGCDQCHVSQLVTGESPFPELSHQQIQPFSDFLLHDMGEGLSDPHAGSERRLWRTAPLWGLKNVRHATKAQALSGIQVQRTQVWNIADKNPIELLHDGRARSLAEAILWHEGAALQAKNAYKSLNKEQRQALEAFLWDL